MTRKAATAFWVLLPIRTGLVFASDALPCITAKRYSAVAPQGRAQRTHVPQTGTTEPVHLWRRSADTWRTHTDTTGIGSPIHPSIHPSIHAYIHPCMDVCIYIHTHVRMSRQMRAHINMADKQNVGVGYLGFGLSCC